MMEFPCVKCHKPIRVKSNSGVTTVACPACHQRMRVAASRDEGPSPAAEGPGADESGPGLASALLVVFGGLAGLVVASLILTAWFFFGRGPVGAKADHASRRPGWARGKAAGRTRIRLATEVALAEDGKGPGKRGPGDGPEDGDGKRPNRPIRKEKGGPGVKDVETPAAPTSMTDQELCEQLIRSVVWIFGTDGKTQWTGSGAVIHVGRRLIVTNRHVVQSQSQVQVLFPMRDSRGEVIPEKKEYIKLLQQGKGMKARVLHADKGRDLAVLQLEGRLPVGTVAVKVAPRPAARAERILLVGNPGLSSALWVPTPGTVRSRVSRADTIGYNHRCLETLLGTHGGDSGSPIVNARCQLVGIHFAAHKALGSTLKYAADRDEVLAVLGKIDVEKDEVLASDTLPVASAVVLKLIKQIEGLDRKKSLEGVEALGKVDREAARRAIPALARALQRHKDEDFRRAVTEELERVGPPVKADLDCIGPVMALSYRRARLYVIDALGQMGADAAPAIPVLVQALKDSDSGVRKKAATVLRDLGPTARPRAFRALLASSDDEDEEVAKAAFVALLELGKLTPAEVELLLEAVGNVKRRILVRRLAAIRLGEQRADASKAVPTLTRLLQTEKDNWLVKLCADSLGQIGEKPKETLTALLQAVLTHSDEAVRLAALNALNQLDLSVFSTSQMLERTSIDHETSPKVRLRIAQLMDVRFASLKSENMAEVRPVLKHKDPKIILIGLGLVIRKKEGAVLVPDLAGLVNHSDDKVSDEALKALGVLGPEARSGLEALLKAFRGVARERQLKFALFVAVLEPKNQKVREAVLPALIDGLHPARLGARGQTAREAILKALVAIGQPAVEAIFDKFGTISYVGRDNATHRKHLFMALQGLAADCKSKDNYDKLKEVRAKEQQKGYEDSRAAAGRALAAMDPAR